MLESRPGPWAPALPSMLASTAPAAPSVLPSRAGAVPAPVAARRSVFASAVLRRPPYAFVPPAVAKGHPSSPRSWTRDRTPRRSHCETRAPLRGRHFAVRVSRRLGTSQSVRRVASAARLARRPNVPCRERQASAYRPIRWVEPARSAAETAPRAARRPCACAGCRPFHRPGPNSAFAAPCWPSLVFPRRRQGPRRAACGDE